MLIILVSKYCCNCISDEASFQINLKVYYWFTIRTAYFSLNYTGVIMGKQHHWNLCRNMQYVNLTSFESGCIKLDIWKCRSFFNNNWVIFLKKFYIGIHNLILWFNNLTRAYFFLNYYVFVKKKTGFS